MLTETIIQNSYMTESNKNKQILKFAASECVLNNKYELKSKKMSP